MSDGSKVVSAEPWSGFYGRDHELALLRSAWEKTGKGLPQWVALTADSGLGKTRLIHEFYRQASLAQTGTHPYWPATLPLDQMRLELNPAADSFSSVPESEPQNFPETVGSRLRNLRNPPWLWWAMRGVPKSSGRNPSAGASAVYDAAHHLKPHVVRLQLKNAGVDLALDVGKKLASSVADKLSFGIASDLINILEVAEKVRGVARSASANLSGVGERRAADVTALRSLIIENIFLFLNRGIPVILVLDDLHHFDPDSAALVNELVMRLGSRPLPLMLVSTCWPEHWNDGHVVRLAFTAFQKNFEAGAHNVLLHKMPKEEARKFLQAFFPGLDSADSETLIGKTDGNFLFLSQICDELRGRPEFFGWNLHEGLTEDGREFLGKMTTDMEKFIETRFRRFPDRVRIALEVSSYQGSRFAPEMTALVTGQPAIGRHVPPGVSLGPEAVRDALHDAEHSVAVLKSSDRLKEFVHDPYRSIALASLSARRGYSEDVNAAYLAIARDFLSRYAAGDVDTVIEAPHIALLERLVEASTAPGEKIRALSLLLDVAHTRRLYDAALGYVCRIGLVDSGDSEIRETGTSMLNFHWGWELPLKTSVQALQTFSFFGFQPPAGSGLTGKLAEMCGERILPCLQLPVFTFLDTDGTAAVPPGTLLQVSRALTEFRSTFGHVHDLQRWTGIVIRLEDELAGAAPEEDVGDDVLIRMICDRIMYSEHLAPARARSPETTTATAREEYDSVLGLIGRVRSPEQRNVLEAWSHMSRAVFVEDLLPRENSAPERAGLVNRARDLLASSSDATARPESAVRERLAKDMDSNPVVLEALLYAGTLAVETATGGHWPDDGFLTDFRIIASDVASQLEEESRPGNLESLKVKTIEALLATGIFCYTVGHFPGDGPDGNMGALAGYARYVRDTAARLREAEGAGVGLIAVSLRTKLFELDVREQYGDDGEQPGGDEIRDVFSLILREIQLSGDGERMMHGEPPCLLESAVRFIRKWHSMLDAPLVALQEAYAPCGPLRFGQMYSQCLRMTGQ